MNSAENFMQNKQLSEQADSQPLQQLLTRPDIWQLANRQRQLRTGITTGYRGFDALLASRGWPRGATTELLVDKAGIGEMSLILTALAEMTRQNRMVILVNPPHIPYAPALVQAGVQLEKLLILHPRGQRDQLWAAEQSLQSGACGALVNWQGREMPADKDLRRLQIAARDGDCLHFHFRPGSVADSPSPASLRLKLQSDGEQLALQLLKQLNGKSGQRLHLARSPDLVRRDQPLH
ncbi:translesion DNA synthesis-associated protein ImuA [Microbulbifer hydrolyticus]|uniref:Translesion DNA synthesis-associated protein ImuA n=1 Tax=Microbulbifer hydrolyticus TaxID=48074 RepID=A0ABX6J0W7_9GAMM|nr:translesion DNA synthesis-associated protein ImuA [Microbulbifer hydrolyticus]QHQ40729.1 translesion DNA synthesis-associated protein ImuA [Microbulbifer hydrolyticus]